MAHGRNDIDSSIELWCEWFDANSKMEIFLFFVAITCVSRSSHFTLISAAVFSLCNHNCFFFISLHLLRHREKQILTVYINALKACTTASEKLRDHCGEANERQRERERGLRFALHFAVGVHVAHIYHIIKRNQNGYEKTVFCLTISIWFVYIWHTGTPSAVSHEPFSIHNSNLNTRRIQFTDACAKWMKK